MSSIPRISQIATLCYQVERYCQRFHLDFFIHLFTHLLSSQECHGVVALGGLEIPHGFRQWFCSKM